jgi:hypothetical protein
MQRTDVIIGVMGEVAYFGSRRLFFVRQLYKSRDQGGTT